MSRKDARREAAQMHIIDMRQRYHDEIEHSIAAARIYEKRSFARICPLGGRYAQTRVSVEEADSVSAVFAHASEGKVALLDFASYRNPGGGYDNGAWAQEEAICSESDLFNVLSEMRGRFYEQNQRTLNRSLYTDRGIYVPDVLFERRGKETFADVIVVAAPNTGAAMKHGVSRDECLDAMRSRIDAVMKMAADNDVDCLVLGAFGCGVFANEPAKVAGMFAEWLDSHPGQFSHVVFAIPSGGANLDTFKDVLGG